MIDRRPRECCRSARQVENHIALANLKQRLPQPPPDRQQARFGFCWRSACVEDEGNREDEAGRVHAIFCSISTACGFFSYFTSEAAIFSRYGRACCGSLRFRCVRAIQNQVSTRYSFSLKRCVCTAFSNAAAASS